MNPLLIILASALVVGFAALAWRRYRWRQRRACLQHLLDLCDGLELLLNRSQRRMQELQSVLERVPADIGAIAHASLESGLPIRDAKRDVLQHRLWIQQNSDHAAPHELEAARVALQRAHARLSEQITALESAGSELAQATAASVDAARREPATLRRPSATP